MAEPARETIGVCPWRLKAHGYAQSDFIEGVQEPGASSPSF